LGAVLSSDAFLPWGWRVVFGLSALPVVVGLWLPLYVTETPLFLEKTEMRHTRPAGAVRNHRSAFFTKLFPTEVR
jgi:MFS family permease